MFNTTLSCGVSCKLQKYRYFLGVCYNTSTDGKVKQSKFAFQLKHMWQTLSDSGNCLVAHRYTLAMHIHTNVHMSALHRRVCRALSNNIRLRRGVGGIIRITHPLHSSLSVSSSLTGWSFSSQKTPPWPPLPKSLTRKHNFTPPYKWRAFAEKSWSLLDMASRINLIASTSILIFSPLISSWRGRRTVVMHS